ncbi:MULTISPECIES: NAD(P)-binding domain-containing protein [unclassified Marinovum]
MAKVGFIGTGHISAPMARALARDGHSVTVSERNTEVSAALVAANLGIAVADNQGVVDASDVVFLCLRPAVWQAAVAPLDFRAEQQVVSVMAGVALADLAEACAPATRLSVTIPFGFIEQGGCPLPLVGDLAAVTTLFGGANTVLPQRDEAALRPHFAASTLVSAAYGLLETGAGWLADQTGDADAAEVYMSSLVAGILSNADLGRAGRMAEEKAALASPNSLNRQMVEGLAAQGAYEGVPALLDRIARSMG